MKAVAQNATNRTPSARAIDDEHGVFDPNASMPTASKKKASGANSPRVSGRMTARVLALLERRGKKDALLNLRHADLANPEARVDMATVDRLIEVAVAALGAAGLGLAIAHVRDAETYDAAGRLMLAGSSLREAYALALAHQRLWGDGERFKLDDEAGALWIRFEHPGGSPLVRAILAEVALAEVMAAAKLLAGGGAAAMDVRFVHRPLGAVDELEAHFGCAVAFGADGNAIAFSRALADAPLALPRDLLRTVLEHDAARAHAKLPSRSSTVDRARAAARDLPSLGDLAKRLALSPRSLQRKLRDEGASYFEIVDAVRREIVVRLTAQGLSDKRIALEVGFRDAGALARARVRWRRG